MQFRCNEVESRYEVWCDDQLAGFVEYYRQGELLVMPHASVLPAFGGRGIGSAIVEYAVLDAIAQGLTVVPECPFVASWLQAKRQQRSDSA